MINYLVTGGAGFIGTNFVEKLIKKGNKVTIIDNLSVSNSNVPYLKKLGVTFYQKDISKFEEIKDLFKGIDVVVHLAAMNRAQRSIDEPLLAHDYNITGSLNCLESARKANVKKFINVSSSSVYADRKGTKLTEDMSTSPPHPYGVGKLASEHYTRVYGELYDMETLTLRFFSVYGPRQLGFIDKAGVIAKFIHNCLNNEPIKIYGDGTQLRNFTYVEDVVNYLICASESENLNGEIINIAAEREVDVNYLAKFIKKITKSASKIIHSESLKGDPIRNFANISKAKKLLKYTPKIDFEEGIKKTVEWHLNLTKVKKDPNTKICVVGIGYVGLPLAVKFGRTSMKTYGLDLKEDKIKELKNGYDSMNAVDSEELSKSDVEYTIDPTVISKANFIIIAVPTPINEARQPDITLLLKASEMVGKYIQKGSTIVYESTVYPGCTEEECVPVIEKISGLTSGKDFFIGYSPERINPGDKKHTIDKIIKIVSGMNDSVLENIAEIYEKVITAGIYRTSSIKVAEAAKIIENTQRDINIGLMNELAIIFEKLDISTKEVLEAANTKWNFLNFSPGLVGGHCIGVDPYYLVYKAKKLGVNSQIITAGRKINDTMPIWIANQIVKMLIDQRKNIEDTKLLILGLTFKENVNDFRNSKAKELIKELQEVGIDIKAHDPYLTKEQVKKEFNVQNVKLEYGKYDGIILATSHTAFSSLTSKFLKDMCNENAILYDIRNQFSKQDLKERGFSYKAL